LFVPLDQDPNYISQELQACAGVERAFVLHQNVGVGVVAGFELHPEKEIRVVLA